MVKKLIIIFLELIVIAGVYAGLISLCNKYLRENDLLNPMAKLVVLVAMVGGLYLIYRRFCRRLDAVEKKEKS